MPYGNFKTYEEAAIKFSIKLKVERFVEEKELNIEDALLKFIASNLQNRASYVSENAICERIISNILNVVQRGYNLDVWSHVKFDIAEEDGLVGTPDFLIAPVSDIGTTFTRPVVCVAEVKREDFAAGWAQALAEMIAVQRFNNDSDDEVFGIATSGDFWKFGKLKGRELTMDPVSYSATEDLQRLFNVVNWIFSEADMIANKI
ncbi:MAG: hypothetical protein QME81_19675 [bacterium]|nr:hypothetical protein [bacterium]